MEKDGLLDPATQAKFLCEAGDAARLLLSNAKKVAQLVLNFKQLAVDRIMEPHSPFDLLEHLEKTIEELQPGLSDARVIVDLEIDKGVSIDSYPNALAQVVTNLTINSMQHAFEPEAGGRVHIRAELLDGDQVCLEYTDDGCGIDSAVQSRVFEPFFSTRRVLGGSGLGLYIAHQIITRQLQGSIALESGADDGVRFTVLFPSVVPKQPTVRRNLIDLPGRSDHER